MPLTPNLYFPELQSGSDRENGDEGGDRKRRLTETMEVDEKEKEELPKEEDGTWHFSFPVI